MKRFAPLVVLMLAFSVLAPITAQAKEDKLPGKLDWHVSDAFIQSIEVATHKQVGSLARASGGSFALDEVRVVGTGTLNRNSMKATGGGTFVHTAPGATVGSGSVRAFGTWTATGLQSFTSYGCGSDGFPPNFCGGKAVLTVHIVATSTNPVQGHVEADGVLTVDCLIGSPPAGAQEGIKLNVTGVANFDTTEESVNGETLFDFKAKDD